MGRSLNSCFKIMSCAGDPAKDDNLPPPESKTSLGKHRWSFQKRSGMHHVSSNNVITESMPIMNNKQNQEAATDTVNLEKDSVSQKAKVAEHTDEISTLPLVAEPCTKSEQVSDISTVKVDCNIQEDVVVVVQSSIRGHLAKRELEKIRNVVKLQATIRRYLVRRQAVGTLRFILAIVKIQQIIRARLAIRSAQFTAKEKLDEEMKEVMVKHVETKSKKTLPVIRNLASNAFASQLLKSTLKTKPIHISCNSSRLDSECIWLERWMSLTSSYQQKINLKHDDQGEDINIDPDSHQVDNKFQVAHEHISIDSKLAGSDLAVPDEIMVDSISNSSENIELDSPLFPIQNDQLDSHIEKDESNTGAWVNGSSDSVRSPIFLSSDEVLELEINGDSNKPNYFEDTNKNSTKKELYETLEVEIGQGLIESKKSRNPGFAAVHAKFEELSAASSSNKSLSHVSKDTKSDSKSVQAQLSSNLDEFNVIKSVSFQVGTKFKEVCQAEDFAYLTSGNQVAATLEHGDEISKTFISEISEAGLSEIVPQVRTLKGKSYIVGNNTNCNNGDMTDETEYLSCDSNVVHQKIMAESSENSAISINTSEPVQVIQQSAESADGPHVDKPSQEGSPRSHIIVPESQGIPSSQIITDAKTTKSENNIPLRKKMSQSLIDSSPTDSKNDSGALTSGEHLKKDTRNPKRSFSMVKTDHVDHEHQTNSSNLVPSYMQPTESARAKVNTSISQKSSPEKHDKDNQIKKRHSLPNGDGKQSSPRMQRSTSQVQQNLKGNGIHSPHTSTERRWLR